MENIFDTGQQMLLRHHYVRNGDEEAFAALYQKYFPLLLRLKNTYYLRNYVTEDWEQEARIALYQALRTYEKSKGVSFGSGGILSSMIHRTD